MYSIYTIIHASSLLKKFQRLLPLDSLGRIARDCGFVRRTSPKITPWSFLLSCLLAVSSGSPNLRCQALFLGLFSACTLSKQALHERMGGQRALSFLNSVLARLLASKIDAPSSRDLSFPRILIQDSTCLSLLDRHKESFPGASNGLGRSAGLRIQCLFDLLTERFVHFSISPYTRNDQAAASDPLPFLRSGDLLLRDLGYFAFASLQAIARLGAFFLTRSPANALFFDPLTGQPLDLLRLLDPCRPTDISVLLGTQHRLPVRLLAVPLPQDLANSRRRKARHHRDRRTNHSQSYYALLSWAIFLTNADSSRLPISRVCDLYRLRWRIETLFKAWKSHLRLDALSGVGTRQIHCLLCAQLILALLFHCSLPLTNPSRSVLKLASLFRNLFLPIALVSLGPPHLLSLLSPQISTHCSYEKRRRLNYQQIKLRFLP